MIYMSFLQERSKLSLGVSIPFASQTSSSSSTHTSTTASNSASQPATNASVLTATNTALSNQSTSTSKTSSPEVSSLELQTTVANQSAEEQPTQTMTNATSGAQQEGQETAEKLDKIQAQNQTPEASKGQPREVSSQKENVSPVVQTNLAQKQNTQTSSKANQSDKSSQTNQTSKSSLPNTGDVSTRKFLSASFEYSRMFPVPLVTVRSEFFNLQY